MNRMTTSMTLVIPLLFALSAATTGPASAAPPRPDRTILHSLEALVGECTGSAAATLPRLLDLIRRVPLLPLPPR